MKLKYTLLFPNWKDPGCAPQQKVITFTNDGQYTTNSVTSLVIPMNEETFTDCIKTYVASGEASLIPENKVNVNN